MTYFNRKVIPTSEEAPLVTNPDGDPDRYKKWSYASVIGMMMYLDSNSRMVIQIYALQCDCLTQNYQASHEDAIICICCYLKDTQKKGLIFIPTRKYRFNCYVESDFTGLFYYKDPHDPVCDRSQSGYVVTFANFTILWVSKL